MTLLQFLYKNSKYFEIDLLLKFASNESAEKFLEKNHKKKYKIYLESNKTPKIRVWLSMINRIKATGVDISLLEINSFDDIKKEISKNKKNKKNEKYNYYFKNITHPELTQNLISSILVSEYLKKILILY